MQKNRYALITDIKYAESAPHLKTEYEIDLYDTSVFDSGEDGRFHVSDRQLKEFAVHFLIAATRHDISDCNVHLSETPAQ